MHSEVKEVLQHPKDYWGAITGWVDTGYGPTFMRHRDSDILEISNWETILKRFDEMFTRGEDFVVEGSGHWAVGWTDELVVRVVDCKCRINCDRDIKVFSDHTYCWKCESRCTETAIFREVLELRARLDNYSILDEEDLSNREYEEMIEWLSNEIGKEKAEDCYTYLYEVYSVSRPEDCHHEWVTEWLSQS